MALEPRFLPVQRVRPTNHRTSAASTSASGPSYSANGAEWWGEAESNLFTQWADTFEKYNDSFNNPYFDYFYTGADIQVTIDGADNADGLPIYSFGYNIQQQKQPLYGFWSYTYDGMLRGTRIVSGAFSIISMYPYLLTQRISEAAAIRAKTADNKLSSNMQAIRGLDEDEAYIDRYWRRNYDSNLDPGQQHIFSVHPPFNFVIRYGLQETSVVAQNPSVRAQELRNKFGNNNPLFTDTNERLVKNPSNELDTRILLENVEIISKSLDFDSEGNVLMENYTFIARDERFLRLIDKDQLAPIVSDLADTSPTQSGGGGGGRVLRS